MARALRFMAAHPWAVLALALLFSAAAAPGVYDFRAGQWRVDFDPSADRLMARHDDAGEFYRLTRKLFGSDETLIVGLLADDVFRAEPLTSLLRISQRVSELPGVHHVSSLATVAVPHGDADDIRLSPLLVRVPDGQADRMALRRAALANPLLAGRLVSRDGRLAAIVVELADVSDRVLMRRALDLEIMDIAHREARGVEVQITGPPRLKRAAAEMTAGALRGRLPLALLCVCAALTFAFKTARGMLLPLVTVALAQLWTFALLGALGRPLNSATVGLPLVLVILSLIYPVHVIAAYYDEIREWPERPTADSMVRALRRVGMPMLLAALTTAASLLAAVLTPVSALREFAAFALAGTLVAFAASVTVTPAMLLAFGRPSGFRRGPAPVPPDRYARFAARVAHVVMRWRHPLIAAFIGLFAVSALAAVRVRTSTDLPHAFPRGDSFRQDFDALNRRLDGATSLRVVVEGDAPDTFTVPANVRELERLEDWLESQPDVGGATSLADWLKVWNGALSEGGPPALALPGTASLTAELLALGRGDERDSLVDGALQRANLVVYTRSVSTGDIRALAARIESHLAELPAPLRGRVTGQAIAFQRLTDAMVEAQLESLVFALIVAYAILSLLFLSPWAGLRALAPSAVALAFCFGFFGAVNAPLSLATAIVPPIVLGFALNGTIHYFMRFTAEARRLADEEAAAARALVGAGRPVTFATHALMLGFLVLATGPIGELRWLGVTAALSLGVAWLCAFVLAPALCADLHFVTLWDTLSLDLGATPQRSIPLLRDLTAAQCRIVGQHGTQRRVPAGQPLLRSGDEGREMFLVIDGVLQASIETPHGREVLNRFARGDLVGEVSYYTRKHSAEIEVLERARLLRLSERGLAQLERRAPKISAVLYRNLARILASRVAETTTRIQ
ncbi:MAG TPA: MMPL family transporter [Myxococcota bacterium]|nr:MMPL family transporter [Myxococcota bacterium]